MTERGRGSDAPPAFFVTILRGIRRAIPYRGLIASGRYNIAAQDFQRLHGIGNEPLPT